MGVDPAQAVKTPAIADGAADHGSFRNVSQYFEQYAIELPMGQ